MFIRDRAKEEFGARVERANDENPDPEATGGGGGLRGVPRTPAEERGGGGKGGRAGAPGP